HSRASPPPGTSPSRRQQARNVSAMTSAASSGLAVRRSTYPVIATWFAAYISSNRRRRASGAPVSDVRTAAPLDTSNMSAQNESISRSTLLQQEPGPHRSALLSTRQTDPRATDPPSWCHAGLCTARRANGSADETEPNRADSARPGRQPILPPQASETRRNPGDQEDARRSAHNPATTGVPDTCPMGR